MSAALGSTTSAAGLAPTSSSASSTSLRSAARAPEGRDLVSSLRACALFRAGQRAGHCGHPHARQGGVDVVRQGEDGLWVVLDGHSGDPRFDLGR